MLDRPEDEAEKEAAAGEAAANRNRELLAQSRHDQMLLATYTSAEQIETAKQRRLQTPQLSLELSRKKIGIERARLIDLLQREAALTEENKPIPRSLKKDIESAESDIERLAKDIETRQLSLDQIVQRFDNDKARFRELTVPQ